MRRYYIKPETERQVIWNEEIVNTDSEGHTTKFMGNEGNFEEEDEYDDNFFEE